MTAGEIAGILIPQADQADRCQHFEGFVADVRFLLAYQAGRNQGYRSRSPSCPGGMSMRFSSTVMSRNSRGI